ncbi:hypothetical protein CD798_18200 [Bacillaceae bacterium SAOS 7]|nr:hypothetical protein CD798_18200 [Bacillaceae bacterium SAOS 7]
MKIHSIIILTLLSIFMLAGCSSSDSGFSTSSEIADFPIPTEAKKVKHDSQLKNTDIKKYQRYNYSKADEIGSIDESYLKEIKDTGWIELEEEQLGAIRFFEKEKRKVAIDTKDGYIILMELKQ